VFLDPTGGQRQEKEINGKNGTESLIMQKKQHFELGTCEVLSTEKSNKSKGGGKNHLPHRNTQAARDARVFVAAAMLQRLCCMQAY
jgi:hypothetical protein